jgi:predicted metal-dependent hydrolase
MINFDYQIIRRPRRKTASISVKPDCSVRILVPSTLSEQNIIQLVERKSQWIQGKISHFQEIHGNQREKEYISGESFTYLGRNYRLKIVADCSGGSSDAVKLVNGRFNVHVPSDMLPETHNQVVVKRLTEWYREHAIVRLRAKTKRYAKQMNVSPVSVDVKDYKSRWGGCHSDGRIYYNWKIIIAPHSIVDYVVVHELSHLVYGDHSKKFWKLLGSIIPDYAERKELLKVNGSGLRV